MRTLVIIPTYNEVENITHLLPEVLARPFAPEVLVVDDNSPDGTGEAVKSLSASNPKVHLLSRPAKQGLGKAYLAGFEWGLSRGYEALIEMDADFSHAPKDLDRLVEALQTHDFVVGSRWVTGGGTENWGLLRQMISQGGSLYSRLILGYPLKDWTGGFNAWRAATLLSIGLKEVRSEGYSFQIELKYRSLKKGFKGLEIPIWFVDRRVGQSKMSSRIVIEALFRVWQIRKLVGR